MEHTMSSRRLKKVSEEAPKEFALASRYQHETAVLKLLDPVDYTDTGIRIEIASQYSDEAYAAVARPALVIGDEVTVETPVADRWLEQTIAVTRRWWHEGAEEDGLRIDPDQPRIPCTPENVRALYSDRKTRWVQKQVQLKYLSLEDFFDAPKAS
jgi:hypothetical protein